MKIHISNAALDDCKEQVQKFSKKGSDFKEIGGYLVGTYDGDFQIEKFLLDTDGESTSIQIKISTACYDRVQELLADHQEWQHIGTWHVHPGKRKPAYSLTDQTTLFLEKAIIQTDNPEEYNCPRIHLIFSEDLKEISGFKMHIDLAYEMKDYWNLEKTINEEDIDQVDAITEDLGEIKTKFLKYKKKQDTDALEECFSKLGNIYEEIEVLIDEVENIIDFQEIFLALSKERKNIENQLKAFVKNGETLGILAFNDTKKIELFKYRPNLITDHQEDGTLLGFWRHFPMINPPIELQEVFFTNFFRKIEKDLSTSIIYILSDPSTIKFYDLKITEFLGISFVEVEIIKKEAS
ncbi:MAG: hypothetical protein LUQ65_08205 [Candidatus Helarchaeota archaeon]|nr:hypothetical protein [Candidatus Helarchaeota archaeon]